MESKITAQVQAFAPVLMSGSSAKLRETVKEASSEERRVEPMSSLSCFSINSEESAHRVLASTEPQIGSEMEN